MPWCVVAQSCVILNLWGTLRNRNSWQKNKTSIHWTPIWGTYYGTPRNWSLKCLKHQHPMVSRRQPAQLQWRSLRSWPRPSRRPNRSPRRKPRRPRRPRRRKSRWWIWRMEKDLRAHPRRCGGFFLGFLMGFCGKGGVVFWKEYPRLGTHLRGYVVYCIRTSPRRSTMLHFSVTHCRSSIPSPQTNCEGNQPWFGEFLHRNCSFLGG